MENKKESLVTLEKIIRRYTIPELKVMGEGLGIRFKSGLKKEQMVQSLYRWLLENPRKVVGRLLTYELRLYDTLINHPEENLYLGPQIHRFPFDWFYVEGTKMYSYIFPELAEKIGPLLKGEIGRR